MSTLHAFSTDAFPYTVGYVSELLGLNDAELAHYARMLGIAQQNDERTGKLIFFHKDVELLKRAVEAVKTGESIEQVANRLAPGNPVVSSPQAPMFQQPSPPQPSQFSHVHQSHQLPQPSAKSMRFQMSDTQPSPYSPDNFPGSQPATPMTVTPPVNPKPMQAQSSSQTTSVSTNRDALAMMVETVSQVKEGILKDLSRMLDDKLSGLDEVVVQLIRAQSENESLKKKIDELTHRNNELEQEVESFKPVQFGFYKKMR